MHQSLLSILIVLRLVIASPETHRSLPAGSNDPPSFHGVRVPQILRGRQSWALGSRDEWVRLGLSPPSPATTAVKPSASAPLATGNTSTPESSSASNDAKTHLKPAPGSCEALSQIYSDMGGKTWYNRTGWNNQGDTYGGSEYSLPCCNWFGVGCKGTSITTLDLAGNGLDGVMSPSIFALPDLEKLSLRLNSITGDIPDSFSNLAKLRSLDISNNILTGSIPGSLATHSALTTIHASNNQLSGFVGFSGPSLSNIQINNNRFGGLAISSSIPVLQRLEVNGNQIKGTLPDLSGATSLQIFNAANNSLYVFHFTGPLFDLTALDSLQRFDVRNNSLNGPFPHDVSELDRLSHLYLGGNHFSGIFPSTPAPTSLTSCNALPNDLQGLPSQDTMNDGKSLANKC
ncbi:L domain-like protein, partial [Clavulina sp. PMI_390]